MEKTVLISLSIEELQALIINCVVSCLKHSPNPGAETNKQWLNLEELCNYLPEKPAKATVYAWVSNQKIPFHKKTRALFFLKAEIDDWLSLGRKATLSEIADDAIKSVKINSSRRKR